MEFLDLEIQNSPKLIRFCNLSAISQVSTDFYKILILCGISSHIMAFIFVHFTQIFKVCVWDLILVVYPSITVMDDGTLFQFVMRLIETTLL